jgi:hypothetical protein
MTASTRTLIRIPTAAGYCIRPDGGVNDGYGRLQQLAILDNKLVLLLRDREGRTVRKDVFKDDVSWMANKHDPLIGLFHHKGAVSGSTLQDGDDLRSRIASAVQRSLLRFEADCPDIGADLPPMAGHAVRLKPTSSSHAFELCKDKIGIISGRGAHLGGIVFNAYTHHGADLGSFACSGGPGASGQVGRDQLRRVGEAIVGDWRWKNLCVGVGNGENVWLNVPLWEWDVDAYEAGASKG